MENNFSTLCQIIPAFEDILPDSDKVSLLANLTVTNFIIARTKLKTVSEIPEDVVVIINVLGESNSCRSWKTLVSDLFMDKSFSITHCRCQVFGDLLSTVGWYMIRRDLVRSYPE